MGQLVGHVVVPSTDSGEIEILAYLAGRIGDAIMDGKGGHFILVRLPSDVACGC